MFFKRETINTGVEECRRPTQYGSFLAGKNPRFLSDISIKSIGGITGYTGKLER